MGVGQRTHGPPAYPGRKEGKGRREGRNERKKGGKKERRREERKEGSFLDKLAVLREVKSTPSCLLIHNNKF
jgi:hypothetical protein